MRPRFRRLKAVVLSVTCAGVFATASCMTKQFANDIATDAARDLANILVNALVIDPVDQAVNPDE